jgi:hypothetical protein
MYTEEGKGEEREKNSEVVYGFVVYRYCSWPDVLHTGIVQVCIIKRRMILLSTSGSPC